MIVVADTSPINYLVLIAQIDLLAGRYMPILIPPAVHAEVVLIDEKAGRQEALRRGLKVAGTLSVLDEADQSSLVIFLDAVA
jgi:predicted nucleic acid-binding protein